VYVRDVRLRLVQLYAGLLLYGVSSSLLVLAGLGLDPWDVFHQGLSRTFGLAIGTWAIIVGVVVLLLWIPLRQRPGIGTVSNVVLVGLTMNVVLGHVHAPHALGVRIALLACGVFLNGVATALGHIRDKHLANVRLWRGDALEVLQRIPDAALSFLYLLHPDPWPKSRHAKRRMVNDRPIDLFAAKLKPGGEFRLATDDPTYLTWSLMIMQRHVHQFEWLAERPKDFLEPSGGWIETRYGAKSRREGRRPYYLSYRRLG